MPLVQRIPFEAFGQAFMELVLTDQVLSAFINKALPKDRQQGSQVSHGVAYIAYSAGTGTAHVEGSARAGFLVKIPLTVQLGLSVAGLPETLDVKATVPFMLRPETWTPLEIRIAYDPVAESAIELERNWGAGLPLDSLLGGAIDEGLRKAIADQVNGALADSEAQRRIDLLALVKQALAKMTGGGDPAEAPHGPPDGHDGAGDGSWERPLQLGAEGRLKHQSRGALGAHFRLPASGAAMEVKVCVKGPQGKYVDVQALDPDKVVLSDAALGLYAERDDWNVQAESFARPAGQIIRVRPHEDEELALDFLLITGPEA